MKLNNKIGLLFATLCFAGSAAAQPADGYTRGVAISQCIVRGLAGPAECHRKFDEENSHAPIPDWAYWPTKNYHMIEDIGQGKWSDLFDKLTDWAKDQGKSLFQGSGTGDPHNVSFSGIAFDFMAKGEFVYTSLGEGLDKFEVDVRQKPYSGQAAIIDAVAVKVGSSLVEVYLKRSRVYVNGNPIAPLKNHLYLLHATDYQAPTDGSQTPYVELYGALIGNRDEIAVIDRNGNAAIIDRGSDHLNVYVALLGETIMNGQIEGVLGSPLHGLSYRQGGLVPSTFSRSDFAAFAEGFAIAGSDSPFRQGQYVGFDAAFPAQFASLDNISPEKRARLEARVQKLLGANANPIVQKACVFDLAFGGKKYLRTCARNHSEPVTEIELRNQ